MRALLKLLIIPFFLIGLDIYFRSSLLPLYSRYQLFFYLISMLVSIGYFVLIVSLLRSISHKKWAYYLIIVVFLIPWFVSFIASFSFYSMNGIFPNYYTFLYFKTEPKSAFMIIRDAGGWKELLMVLMGILVLIYLLHRFIKSHVLLVKKQLLLWGFIIHAVFFQSLVFFQGKYDQCATVDVNFAACIQRHATTWDDFESFNGTGLSLRHKPKLRPLKTKKKFNVVVVIFESLRKRSLQIYGHKHATTPNLMAFSKQYGDGFYQFQQPASVSSTTMLAVPAILTGINPCQDSSVLYHQPLIWELGQMLNYKTFFISSHTLEWYRFDRFFSKENLDVWWNQDNSGHPYYNDLGHNDGLTITKVNQTINAFSKEPFFGVFQLNTTHFPYESPEKYKKWSGTFSNNYDNAVYYQDVLIGRFLENLKQQKLLENTVVIFASDHGESMLEHHTMGHVENYYSEAISIPMFAYIPPSLLSKEEAAALRYNCGQLTSNIDIAPTLVDLLDLNNNKDLTPFLSQYMGFSLLKPIPNDRKVISLNNNQIASFNTGLSVASKDWHYLFRTNIVPNKEEFYFWKKDIGELINRNKQLKKKQRQEILQFIQNFKVCEKYLKNFQ